MSEGRNKFVDALVIATLLLVAAIAAVYFWPDSDQSAAIASEIESRLSKRGVRFFDKAWLDAFDKEMLDVGYSFKTEVRRSGFSYARTYAKPGHSEITLDYGNWGGPPFSIWSAAPVESRLDRFWRRLGFPRPSTLQADLF